MNRATHCNWYQAHTTRQNREETSSSEEKVSREEKTNKQTNMPQYSYAERNAKADTTLASIKKIPGENKEETKTRTTRKKRSPLCFLCKKHKVQVISLALYQDISILIKNDQGS